MDEVFGMLAELTTAVKQLTCDHVVLVVPPQRPQHMNLILMKRHSLCADCGKLVAHG